MDVALWIVSGLVAFAMLAAGGMKLVTPRAQLANRMTWARTWTDGRVKLLGVAEVLGAVGLIVPRVTGIAPVLTPIAAACVAVLMLGAVKTHRDLGEPIVAPAVLALLAVVVALGTTGVGG